MPADPTAVTALTHATLIAAPGERPPEPDMTLLLTGDRITAVGPSATTPVPPGARTVDLTGRYVVPGLFDAHVHTIRAATDTTRLYPLMGVTTVREMWGTPAAHAVRARAERGDALGPRWVMASTFVDGSPGLWTADLWAAPTIEAGTEAEAREAVRRIAADGADFVKVYTRLGREPFHALADEARRRGLPFAGHCPDAVPVTEASDAGQLTVEHLHPLLLSTSAEEAGLRQGLARVRVDPGEGSTMRRYHDWFVQVRALEQRAVQSYDRGRAHRAFDHLARNRTYITPTLGMHRTIERPDTARDHADEWRYVPHRLSAAWPQQLEPLLSPGTGPLFERRLRTVGELHARGVPLLAGTDTGTPCLVPGFALHHELALLTDAGLPPAVALHAATVAPARAFGLAGTLGTISPGKAADLVVLAADPLRDIRNTLRITAVVTRGRLIDEPERHRLLEDLASGPAS
ncbi:amidohydrolase [Streptomyces mashuensis]|uniref:Amidohydrolase n=1 Tax=Streptomyces mashuensis TaxID=33904 RepID=A0A919B4A2_9ACTN|nr:amidohydrolase family protein [Streptomyces mashuensis]GHF45479.1 amidohydrolase [Streptomyces mashuensis]